MKQFDLITETDALRLQPGETIELAAGGHITPLAQDTLRVRRIRVVGPGQATGDGSSLVPAADVRAVSIGSDHSGIALKKALVAHLRSRAIAVTDVGTDGPEPVDYPDIAAAVARPLADGEVHAGIVIDGAGIGSAIAANKIAGIRAVMATTTTIARYSREHNGANVLTLGATLLSVEEAKLIVDTWLATPMREPRYIQRLEKIRRLERGNLK
jgi:ribose 5-phosphate isomerase B